MKPETTNALCQAAELCHNRANGTKDVVFAQLATALELLATEHAINRCPVSNFENGDLKVSELIELLQKFPQDAKVNTTGIHVWGLLNDVRVEVGTNLYRLDVESERLPWLK